jgi:HD-GYP domain-containing protein (c-di-GMP phosphodiesterase class II)
MKRISEQLLVFAGALLHDICRIGISDAILLKPGPLTEAKWELMRQYPQIGGRIIDGIPFLKAALPVIRSHQARWDGSGHPVGLKIAELPLQARIFAVADVFDVLISHRPCRRRLSARHALEHLGSGPGIQFDPEIVAAPVDLVAEGPTLEHVVQ